MDTMREILTGAMLTAWPGYLIVKRFCPLSAKDGVVFCKWWAIALTAGAGLLWAVQLI